MSTWCKRNRPNLTCLDDMTLPITRGTPTPLGARNGAKCTCREYRRRRQHPNGRERMDPRENTFFDFVEYARILREKQLLAFLHGR